MAESGKTASPAALDAGLLDEIVRRVVEAAHPERIILFGSAARGEQGEHTDPSDPRAWLRRARSDLALARSAATSADILYEDLCFHPQQAVEKAIKGVLVQRSVEFPKTHDLNLLLGLAVASRVSPVRTTPERRRAAAQR